MRRMSSKQSEKPTRKTKYETVVKPKLVYITRLAKEGYTNEDIAKRLGIGLTTFKTYRKRHPELQEALQKGKEVALAELEETAFKSAMGHYYREEYMTKDGKVVELKKYAKPEPSTMIFLLRNMERGKWTNRELVDEEKIKAETEFTKARTKILEGVDKDITMMEEFMKVLKETKGKETGNDKLGEDKMKDFMRKQEENTLKECEDNLED